MAVIPQSITAISSHYNVHNGQTTQEKKWKFLYHMLTVGRQVPENFYGATVRFVIIRTQVKYTSIATWPRPVTLT